MHREGHHGLNALLYTPIAVATALFGSIELAIVGAMLMVGTASLPDFDRHFDNNMNSHRSDLWTLIPIKHRGFTHTVWFAAIIGIGGAGLALVMAPPHPEEFTAAFGFATGFLGVVGHILGDAMTPMGVKPFSPLRKTKYSFGWFKAKNRIANYGFLFIGGIALIAGLGFGFSETGIDLENYAAIVATTLG